MKNTACSGNGYKTAQKTERSVFTRMCSVLEKQLLNLCRIKA